MATAPPPLAPSLGDVLTRHLAGRLPEAEEGYRRILQLAPDNADARHLLGVLRHQQGRHGDAIEAIGRAIEIDPSQAVYHCNLGEACRALGRIGEAIACQRRALALDPALAEAHNNLGLALEAQGARDEAEASYERALAKRPAFADALINLGNLLAADGRLIEATEHFERALERDPGSVKAHYNIANALREQGLLVPAIAYFERTLALAPDHAPAHNNLGLARHEQGDDEGAIRCFEAAIALDDGHAQAHNNLGLAREAKGDLDAARGCYERALALEPSLAQAHNNLGRVRMRSGAPQEAMASFHRALAFDPDYADAHHNLGHVLKDQGRLGESIEAFLRAVEKDADHADPTAQLLYQLQHACRWQRLAELGRRVDEQTEAALAAGRRPGETPFGSLRRSSIPARHLAVARAWARGIERQMARTGVRFSFDHRRAGKARLRIGYLSCDFRDHPVAHQVRKLFELHDRNRFEVRAYAYGPQTEDAARARIAAACDAFIDLEPLSDLDAARRIFDDEVDILVDLTGYTKGNRIQLAALRPAPVQVSYLGMLGTTGGSFMDYLIADPVCVPLEEARHFSEQLVHLPHCCLVFGEDGRPSDRLRRSEIGLPEEGFVFVSLNASYKIEPVMFDGWMGLLREVPDSVLWLYRASEEAVRNLRSEAEQGGVPGHRLMFAERIAYDDNLERLRLADLGLDTRVYNGGLTTANALWAGVPVITLKGSDAVSRMGASMLAALGLPELVTSSLDAYRALALELASRPERLRALERKLAANLTCARLFDTPRFARHLEAAFAQMWAVFQRREKPRPIEVPPVSR